MSDQLLPKDYQPFPKMVMCGNTLIDVRVPFEIDGKVPLLIGNNGKPRIWLNAPPSGPGLNWQPVVRANRSLHRAAVVTGAGTDMVSVTVKGLDVLSLMKGSDDIPEVIKLDLRPLGLNIYGDAKKLTVGMNQLIQNTFRNVRVMVGIRATDKPSSD